MAKSNLPKFTLEKNEKKDAWDLRNDKTDRLVKTFDTKGDATKGGRLERAVGPSGGSVDVGKLGYECNRDVLYGWDTEKTSA